MVVSYHALGLECAVLTDGARFGGLVCWGVLVFVRGFEFVELLAEGFACAVERSA